MSRSLIEHLSKNQSKFYSQAKRLTRNKEKAWDIIQMAYEFLLKRDQNNNFVNYPDSYLHLLIVGRYLNNRRLADNKLFDSFKCLDDQKFDLIEEESFSVKFEQLMSDINQTCYPAEIKAVEYMMTQNRLPTKEVGSRYQSLKTSKRLAVQRMKNFYAKQNR